MATTISITKQADGTWQGSFTSTGTRTIVQVERQENAPLYLNISADDGQHNVIYQPPKDFKNQILSIDIAEGALVTIVSHSAVTKAQYIASELDYYTKTEVDEKIGEIYSLEPVVVDTLPTASEDTMKKLYFVPKTGGGETGNVKEEYITVRTVASGSGTEADPYVYSYSWEQVGDTSVQLQADWNQTNTSAADFIKNKPTIPVITGKADKVTGATSGNFSALDENGNLTDSGHKHSDYLTQHQDISGKADKVTGATSGNLAGLDSNGNLTDSGSKASDFEPSLPSKTGNGGKVLSVNSGGTAVEWRSIAELPAVTSSDNGKILIVDNGAWSAQSVPVADSVLYPNSNN